MKKFNTLMIICAAFFILICIGGFIVFGTFYEPYKSGQKFIEELEVGVKEIEQKNADMQKKSEELAEMKSSNGDLIERYNEVQEWNERIKSYLQ